MKTKKVKPLTFKQRFSKSKTGYKVKPGYQKKLDGFNKRHFND